MPMLSIGTIVIPYTIEVRPRRRYLAIQVDSQHRLKVLVPPGYPLHDVEPFLLQKSRWIMHHVMRPDSGPPMPSKTFVNGEAFLLRGEMVRLKIVRSEGQVVRVHCADEVLEVGLPTLADTTEAERVRDALVEWYRDRAIGILSARIKHYRGIVGRGPTRLKIAEYKSRWGFCRADGLIALNWRIIQAPEPVIDYVVVHELTHLDHPHHQGAFWQALEVILPHYRLQKKWLRDHGAELGAW